MKSLSDSATAAVASAKANRLRVTRSRSEFVQAKFDWLEQVFKDKALPKSALRVVGIWHKWLNSETWTAWPSQETVARELDCSIRTVGEGLRALEERGHLICLNDFRGGRHSNRYRIVLKGEVQEPPMDEPDINAGLETEHDTPEDLCRSASRTVAGHPSEEMQTTTEKACGGTRERTRERTCDEMSKREADLGGQSFERSDELSEEERRRQQPSADTRAAILSENGYPFLPKLAED